MTYEEITKATLEELEARKEAIDTRLFYLEMADMLIGKEYEEYNKLTNEKMWIIEEIRERRQADQA